MFLSRNKKNNVYPCKPQFYYITVGLSGSKLHRHVFVMFLEMVGSKCSFCLDCINAPSAYKTCTGLNLKDMVGLSKGQ